MKKIYGLALAFACITGAFAQNAGRYDLSLVSGKFPVAENTKSYINGFKLNKQEVINGKYYRFIQFYEIPSNEQREALKNQGLELMLYLPNYTYMAAVNENFSMSILSSYNVRSIMEVLPAYKLSEDLSKNSIPDYAKPSVDKVSLNVLYYPDVADKSAFDIIGKDFQITNVDEAYNMITCTVKLVDINKLAALPFVYFIEPIGMEPYTENSGNRTLHRSSSISVDMGIGRKYNGDGINISIQDDGMIGPHVDWKGRIGGQFLTTNSTVEHADHCSGIICAAGNMQPQGRGMAWGATIWVYSMSGYGAFSAITSDYANRNVRITSSSIGSTCNGGYDTQAGQLDQQIRTMPQLMHVFSAGNSGTSNCNYGAGAGWGNITGGHKMAKNLTTVGNLDSLDGLNSSSSRGPAKDGRMKPEVCGQGTNVWSTKPVDTYQFMTGTSMSCPGVAGTYAQLYHAYKVNNSNQLPNSDLIKAILMNTCEDLGNAGPDFKTGYGRINALRAAKCIEAKRYMTDNVANGANKTHTITVPANTKQVKVMVYWHDYQASASASPQLVNNLDIVLKDPSNQNFQPWVLDPTPNATNLNAPAVRGTDNLNNHEQVTIDNPAAGTYTLTVTGTTVPQGPQDYVVTYEFVMDEITVTHPIGGESFMAGVREIIRWDAYGTTGTFTVEYSLDNGSTYTTLSSTVNGALRYYVWNTPPSTARSGQCLIRVSRNSVSDVSDGPFNIMSMPTALKVDWACPDSMQVSWASANGATSYDVFVVGQKYMDSVGTTAWNNFVIKNVKPGTDTIYFSVRARGANNAVGRRAYAYRKLPGTFGCTVGTQEYTPVETVLSLYPNPAAGEVNINANFMTSEDVTIKINDIVGREVFNNTYENNGDLFTAKITLSQFAKGVYTVTLIQGTTIKTAKLTVE